MVNIKMKTKVEDINRNIYDIKNEDNYDFKMEKGINEGAVKSARDAYLQLDADLAAFNENPTSEEGGN